jgi:hypothetical protein
VFGVGGPPRSSSIMLITFYNIWVTIPVTCLCPSWHSITTEIDQQLCSVSGKPRYIGCGQGAEIKLLQHMHFCWVVAVYSCAGHLTHLPGHLT